MKDFDLRAAKRGAAVCTRRGLPVRIICWDMKCKSYGYVNRLVYLTDYNGDEHISSCWLNGSYTVRGSMDADDLVMRDDDYAEKLAQGEYGKHIDEATEKVDPTIKENLTVDREYWRRVYAGMAMQGIFAGRNWCKGAAIPDCIDYAQDAVKLADALLEELEKKK